MLPETLGTVLCRCGDDDCPFLAYGYPYCLGCGEHHRAPAAEVEGALCPVDVNIRAYDLADAEDSGTVTREHQERAERQLREEADA